MKTLFFIGLLATGLAVQAQDEGMVGVGTETPLNSTILDITSTDKALLITRVTNVAAVATPVKGMIVYSIAENKFKVYQEDAGVEGWYDLFTD